MKTSNNPVTSNLFHQHSTNQSTNQDISSLNNTHTTNESLKEIVQYLEALNQRNYTFQNQINSVNQSLLIQGQQLEMIQKMGEKTSRDMFAIDKKIQALLRFQLEQSKITIQLARIISTNSTSSHTLEERLHHLTDVELQATNEIRGDKQSISTDSTTSAAPADFFNLSSILDATNEPVISSSTSKNGELESASQQLHDQINGRQLHRYPDLMTYSGGGDIDFTSEQLKNPTSPSAVSISSVNTSNSNHNVDLLLSQKNKDTEKNSPPLLEHVADGSTRNNSTTTGHSLLDMMEPTSAASTTSTNNDHSYHHHRQNPNSPTSMPTNNFGSDTDLDKDSSIMKLESGKRGRKRQSRDISFASNSGSPNSSTTSTGLPNSSVSSTPGTKRRGRPPGRLNNSTLMMRQQLHNQQQQHEQQQLQLHTNHPQLHSPPNYHNQHALHNPHLNLGLNLASGVHNIPGLQLPLSGRLSNSMLGSTQDHSQNSHHIDDLPDNGHLHNQQRKQSMDSMPDSIESSNDNDLDNSKVNETLKQVIQQHPNALYYELKIEEIKTLNSFKEAYLEFVQGIRGNPSIKEQEMYLRNTFGTHYFIQLKQARSFRRRKTLVTFIEKIKDFYNCDVDEACQKLERFKQMSDKTISWVCNHLPNVEDLE